MPRGAAPGERRGGRVKGTPNRTTIERAIRAEREVIETRAAGRKLGKERLDDLLEIFIGATSHFQPVTPAMLAKGAQPNPHEDWDKFERWALNAMNCAKELAKYQSPQFRAILVAPAPETNQPERRKVFELTVFETRPAIAPPAAAPTSDTRN